METNVSSCQVSPTSSSRRPDHNRPRQGRSAPRSRRGCLVCKQRRVRCDELHPVCGHCTRLDLKCVYQKRPKRGPSDSVSAGPPSPAEERGASDDPPIQDSGATSRSLIPATNTNGVNTGIIAGSKDLFSNSPRDLPTPRSSTGNFSFRIAQVTPGASAGNYGFSGSERSSRAYLRDPCESSYGWPQQIVGDEHCNFSLDRTFDPPNGQDSLGTFTFSDIQSNAATWNEDFSADQVLQHARAGVSDIHTASDSTWPVSFDILVGSTIHHGGAHPVHDASRADDGSINFAPGSDYMRSKHSKYLLSYFQKITQPPASILITGVQKWRRLQKYFIRMSHQHRAVASALFAIMELLAKDDQSMVSAEGLNSPSPALKLREVAQKEVELSMSREWRESSKARDALLTSIFLLAWFEVVRDQIFDQRLFPGELADQVITSEGNWNRYSRQLLQWLNTLDSKASHLGGQALLSQRALQIVSEHPTQINTEDSSEEGQSGDERSNDSVLSPNEHTASSNTTPASDYHNHNHGPSPELAVQNSGFSSLRQMKTALLNTILQPALDWHLSTQSYCRRIGAHDRHHRSRFTVRDEYEVVIASKRLELELMHLWRQRPQIIRLSTAQLLDLVCADVADRLDAIFSLYMASFWILFVYLHRVVWWHLPHSEMTQSALEETWKNLQRSFGEVLEGQKVVHPALLWPLFMFGSECNIQTRRDWAIEQLEALGDANTVVNDDDGGEESLAPFRLSIGATRNAKRAAILLRELVRRQTISNCRVDDKDLSIELFGCHFSVI